MKYNERTECGFSTQILLLAWMEGINRVQLAAETRLSEEGLLTYGGFDDHSKYITPFIEAFTDLKYTSESLRTTSGKNRSL